MTARHENVWMRGLSWLEGGRAGFALPTGPPELFRLKVLGELAAIAEVLHRQGDAAGNVAERARALLAFAWEELGRGDVFVAALDAQPLPVLGTMYAVFERMGWRHDGARERLARLGQPGALSRVAAAPAARTASPPVAAQYGADGVAVLCLGLGLAWDVMRLASPWSRRALYPRTRLAQRVAASALTIPEAYSLTHAVYFMTDWGAHPEELPEADRAYLCARAPAWMETFRGQGHFDLYAELAAAVACAGGAADGAEAVLAAAQEEDGRVKGPAARVAERVQGIEDEGRRRFIGAYHTTLAATLASFALDVGLHRAPRREG